MQIKVYNFLVVPIFSFNVQPKQQFLTFSIPFPPLNGFFLFYRKLKFPQLLGDSPVVGTNKADGQSSIGNPSPPQCHAYAHSGKPAAFGLCVLIALAMFHRLRSPGHAPHRRGHKFRARSEL